MEITESCLDAETLAAWVDGGLSAPELATRADARRGVRCDARRWSARSPGSPRQRPRRRLSPRRRQWLAWLVPLTLPPQPSPSRWPFLEASWTRARPPRCRRPRRRHRARIKPKYPRLCQSRRPRRRRQPLSCKQRATTNRRGEKSRRGAGGRRAAAARCTRCTRQNRRASGDRAVTGEAPSAAHRRRLQPRPWLRLHNRPRGSAQAVWQPEQPAAEVAGPRRERRAVWEAASRRDRGGGSPRIGFGAARHRVAGSDDPLAPGRQQC